MAFLCDLIFFNSNMINPNYTVKADPIKIFYSYAMLSAIQILCTPSATAKNLTTYNHLISNKELENFKNNQYIYKLFKFGQ